MKLLAIDTAGAVCAVAVRTGGETMALESEAMDRGQAEELMPMIGRVMTAAGWGFSDLDQIAVTVGPGSFTGLRIGLAAARGLALASAVPVGGVSSFDVAARGARDSASVAGLLAVVLETKRADYYARLYDPAGAPLDDGVALDDDDLAARLKELGSEQLPICLAGDAAVRSMGNLEGRLEQQIVVAPEPTRPAIETVAALAEETPLRGGALMPADPVYIRPPDVRLPSA
ncbi:MAG: tRNA (adenosine(37)-N6)-threonylcarbamoyltransferase complex dimerization subunit type 1 TsaB [Rhodospirillaceae bacterium]|jgi:tRNA threonylcarbamoyladenosine biosynthesis protein TsaB